VIEGSVGYCGNMCCIWWITVYDDVCYMVNFYKAMHISRKLLYMVNCWYTLKESLPKRQRLYQQEIWNNCKLAFHRCYHLIKFHHITLSYIYIIIYMIYDIYHHIQHIQWEKVKSKVKVKISLFQAVEAHRVARG
jgi:hypothetical protein